MLKKEDVAHRLLLFTLLTSCLFITSNIKSKSYRRSFKSSTKKSYTPKTPYAGFGKRSKVNGMIKTKPISGHGKRTNRGYRYVNSYSRSR